MCISSARPGRAIFGRASSCAVRSPSPGGRGRPAPGRYLDSSSVVCGLWTGGCPVYCPRCDVSSVRFAGGFRPIDGPHWALGGACARRLFFVSYHATAFALPFGPFSFLCVTRLTTRTRWRLARVASGDVVGRRHPHSALTAHRTTVNCQPLIRTHHEPRGKPTGCVSVASACERPRESSAEVASTSLPRALCIGPRLGAGVACGSRLSAATSFARPDRLTPNPRARQTRTRVLASAQHSHQDLIHLAVPTVPGAPLTLPGAPLTSFGDARPTRPGPSAGCPALQLEAGLLACARDDDGGRSAAAAAAQVLSSADEPRPCRPLSPLLALCYRPSSGAHR